jgi:hypothetical protein
LAGLTLEVTVTIIEATDAYEAWMRKQIDVVEADLARKHHEMASGVFPFLRATFYRFAATFHEECAEAATAPAILAVGDLHVENFGTWRDAEGRLVWGVNDFDEASEMPYTLDLVRLAASGILAAETGAVQGSPQAICDAVLKGYTTGMVEKKTRPFVLEERHADLREMAMSTQRKPAKFWDELTAEAQPETPPKDVVKLLMKRLPDEPETDSVTFYHRVAGLGSLGRQRWLAVGTWCGGKVAREAKAMLPPAYDFVLEGSSKGTNYEKIVDHAVRVPDPFLKIKDGFVIRRLSPHCARINLKHFPNERDDLLILTAMGHETANIHSSRKNSLDKVRRDLELRKPGWLLDAVQRMVAATNADFAVWQSRPAATQTA